MNRQYSRKDITLLFSISRRIIEGYEKQGLIKPTGHDKYLNNLYDLNTINRIGYIRLYQLMGFKLKEIKEFIDKPINDNKKLLNSQVINLKSDVRRSKALIEVINELINEKDKGDKDWIIKKFKSNKFN